MDHHHPITSDGVPEQGDHASKILYKALWYFSMCDKYRCNINTCYQTSKKNSVTKAWIFLMRDKHRCNTEMLNSFEKRSKYENQFKMWLVFLWG